MKILATILFSFFPFISFAQNLVDTSLIEQYSDKTEFTSNASVPVGSGVCRTTVTKMRQADRGILLSVSYPGDKCRFETLSLLIGNDVLPLSALGNGFFAKDNKFVWRAGVRSADMLFVGIKKYMPTELANFKLNEPNCNKDCLNTVSTVEDISSSPSPDRLDQTGFSDWKGVAVWNKNNRYQVGDCVLDLTPFSYVRDEETSFDFISNSDYPIQDIHLTGSCINGKLEGNFSIKIVAKNNSKWGGVSTASWTGKASMGYPVGVIEHLNGYIKNQSPLKLFCIREEGCHGTFGAASERATKENKQELIKYLTTINSLTIESCKNARVPNPNPLKDESTEFFGECQEGRAITGLVIWKQKNIPFDLSCLEGGKYMNIKEVMNNGFRNEKLKCLESISALPEACFKDGYRGQCNAAGKPDGLGFKYTTSSESMGIINFNIYAGMFKDGMAHGLGNTYSIGRCGMLGCTEYEIWSKGRGYFVSDSKEFHCDFGSGLTGCLEKRDRLAAGKAAENARHLRLKQDSNSF